MYNKTEYTFNKQCTSRGPIGGFSTGHRLYELLKNVHYPSADLFTTPCCRLQVVDKFTYLGSTLSTVVHIVDEVIARIAKASTAFGRLRVSIWDWSGILTQTESIQVGVLPTLLYACETWTVYQRHAKTLNHFHTSCLNKLLKIKW